jgi:TolB-like protein/Tfp pilus assembly protein PilF
MRRFLQFVVDESLHGRASALKEQVIGASVFDRAPDYDPAVDPIVRVEARRLRAKLHEYYRDAGPAAVLIELPKGSYVPLFTQAPSILPSRPRRNRIWWAAVLLAVVPLAWSAWRAPGSARIAVLPIADLSAAKDLGYFGDGLREQLLSSLSRVDGLRALRLDSDAARSAARHRLFGSVRSDGARLRITMELTDAPSGEPLWSQTYDRELQDVFALQDEISAAVVNALRLRLGPRAPAVRFSRDPEAVRLYLQGRAATFERDFSRGVDLLRRAVERDPGFALAWAQLARAYMRFEQSLPTAPSFDQASEAAQRAIEIDPSLADAIVALAVTRVFEWRWPEAEREFRRALALDPKSAEAHGEYAIGCLAPTGRIAEAVREAARAVDLAPLSVSDHNRYGMLLTWAGRNDDAIAELQRALALAPDSLPLRENLGRAYLQGGQLELALRMFQGNRAWTSIALTRARRAAPQPDTGDPVAQARYWTAVGDRDRAFQWLETAVSRKHPLVPHLACDPDWRPLGSDTRYGALLKRIGL